MLSWNQPEDLGGRNDVVYRIKCDACSLGLVHYSPNTVGFFCLFLPKRIPEIGNTILKRRHCIYLFFFSGNIQRH